MTIEKSKLNFFEVTGHYVPNSSLLNLFNLLYDSDKNEYFLNIFRTYIVNTIAQGNLGYYSQHSIDSTDFPDTISNQYYKVPFLWWIVAMFNNIKNPFEDFDPDKQEFLKVLKPIYITQLIQEVQMIGRQ